MPKCRYVDEDGNRCFGNILPYHGYCCANHLAFEKECAEKAKKIFVTLY